MTNEQKAVLDSLTLKDITEYILSIKHKKVVKPKPLQYNLELEISNKKYPDAMLGYYDEQE